MERLITGPVKQAIGMLILAAISATSLYAQEVKTPESTPSPTTVAEPHNGNVKQSSNRATPASGSEQRPSNQDTNQPYVFPTGRERFNRYVSSTVGPRSLLRSGVRAGISQWGDNPEEWGQGMSGYGKRFASAAGKNAIEQTVVYGLDSALGVSTKFEKSDRRGFFPRLKHALVENVTSRNRNGERVISIPRFAGAYSSGIIAAETWYPSRYSYKDGLRNGTTSILTGFGLNLVREFVYNF